MNDKEQAGTSYIISYYNTVSNMIITLGNFINVLLEIKNKHGDNSDASKYDPEERTAILVVSQTLRSYAVTAYIQYEGFLKVKAVQKDDKLEKLYKDIKADLIPKTDSIEEYVKLHNNILVSTIIEELLKTSEKLAAQVYK